MPVEILAEGSPWPTLRTDAYLPQLNAHCPEWVTAVSTGLAHRPTTLIHRNLSGQIDGVLPLVLVKSALFGKFLVSLPYLNTGGVWAETEYAGKELVTHACRFADAKNVRYLELRHEKPIDHPELNASRTDKVHMRLPLPPSIAELDASFKAKLRSQIKKSKSYDLTIEWGTVNLLNDFYDVFAVNMRDLGTPVFSKRLFCETLNSFPNQSELCVVRKDKIAVAAGLLVHCHGMTEVPSASSLRDFNQLGTNMFMYHNMLCRAIERQSTFFDFGRSSHGSGTYKFKEQWGSIAHPANWQYYVRKGSANDMRADAEGKQRLVKIWQKLPVPLTRWIGPPIVRGIP